VTTRTPAPPTPTGRTTEVEKAKPIPSQADPRSETPRAIEPKVPVEPKVQKHAEPSPGPATKSEKQAPEKSARPASDKPQATEKDKPN
jgi:hypothetical protein